MKRIKKTLWGILIGLMMIVFSIFWHKGMDALLRAIVSEVNEEGNVQMATAIGMKQSKSHLPAIPVYVKRIAELELTVQIYTEALRTAVIDRTMGGNQSIHEYIKEATQTVYEANLMNNLSLKQRSHP